jgi:hypothetical protein
MILKSRTKKWGFDFNAMIPPMANADCAVLVPVQIVKDKNGFHWE